MSAKKRPGINQSKLAVGGTHTRQHRGSNTPVIPVDTKYLEKQYRMSVPRPRYAFFTLVMCGDEYVKGALTLAWFLRQQDTKHELVVMTTPDVSVKALKLLRKLYDRVLRVNYIVTRTRSTLRGKPYRDENHWMNYSLTKAKLLKFTEYDKIVWLDADCLVVNNIDNLFDLPAPAGICSSVRNHDYWHGLKLPEELIENSIANNYGIHGCVMVLEPRLENYFLASSQPVIGDRNTFMGPDEFFFTQLYKLQWHHIHIKYGCTRWHMERLGTIPDVIHFVGARPWEKADDIQEWDGTWKWKNTVDQMLLIKPVFNVIFKNQEKRPRTTSLLRLLTET